MCAQRLKNAPLVEAIVEMRWKPKPAEGALSFDPNYNLLLGRLMDVFRDEYAEHQATPNAGAPPEMAAQFGMVQHQFRAKKDGWPLVQVGPSVFTVNETEAYDWEADFRDRAIRAVDGFFKAYQDREQMAVQSLLLRYIDAIDCDWGKECALKFLAKDLGTPVVLPKSLFTGTDVEPFPTGLDLRVSFGCRKPQGTAHLRLAMGQSRSKKAIIMETMVQSTEDGIPVLPGGFAEWLDAAHAVTSTWFERMPSERLYKEFRG
jgi:uncharacterized protein (TIGR04255 family)